MIKFVKMLKNEDGATAIEYGLIAALIAVAAIGAMQGIGNSLDATFTDTGDYSALTERLHALTDEAERAVRANRAAVLIISDRAVADGERLPLPALFAVSSIHRRLARKGLRRQTTVKPPRSARQACASTGRTGIAGDPRPVSSVHP